MSRVHNLLKRSESGQSLIFAAVMGATLMGIMGLAVLGGHVFVEFRRMQAAADMAAIVGAQKLPCDTTDTTCISNAEGQACDYAQKNGYGGGGSGGSTCATSTKSTGVGNSTITTTASVPPVSCSPYDFLDYGNNSSCPGRSASQQTQYVFIEVRIQEPMTVPIFNISFTLSAHAVAKQGVASPTDFAVSVLDPNANPAFTMGGTTNTVVVGDTMANGAYALTGTGGAEVSCDGSWFTAASQSTPATTSFVSNLSGAPNFAPASCTGGTTLYPAAFFPDSPLIPDPYGDTQPPSSSNMPNCLPCESTAYYYTWNGTNRTSGTWAQANSRITISGSNTKVELFPGTYNGGLYVHGGTIYVNPGVYTFTSDFTADSGAMMCIYGAPACDELGTTIPGQTFSCAHAAFSGSTNVYPSDQWYYHCSPWGVWDTELSRANAPGGGPTTTPPIFYDPTGNTRLPLNGVTFYMQSGDFDMNGHADMYMAFPNSCLGTATSGFSPGSAVTFSGNPIGEPSGSKDAYYTYPVGSLAKTDGLGESIDVKYQGTNAQVYPNADLTLAGECHDGLFVWNGEYPSKPKSQHLHFLAFADNTTSNFTLNGSAVEDWWGIWHTFPQNYPGYPGPPTQDCPGGNCNILLNGNGGSSGVPMLEGQVVTGTATFNGNGSVEIFYRPCKELKTPCGNGPGTALVQ